MKKGIIGKISLSTIILAAFNNPALADQADVSAANLDTQVYEELLNDIRENNLTELEKTYLIQLIEQSESQKSVNPGKSEIQGGWTFTSK